MYYWKNFKILNNERITFRDPHLLGGSAPKKHSPHQQNPIGARVKFEAMTHQTGSMAGFFMPITEQKKGYPSPNMAKSASPKSAPHLPSHTS